MINQERYIDMHSHILPGIDDGSRNMNQTIRMLDIAAKEGIRAIIATPHYETWGDNPPVEKLKEVAGQVQEEATKIDKEFKIYLGNELYYSDSIIEDLKSGKALTLAGSSYILVEFSYTVDYQTMYQALSKLIYNGYMPILAHMERYYCLHKQADKVNELVKMGCYTQINCHSLIGGLLNCDASYNRKLLKNDLVHFIGSDSHSDNVRAPIMEKSIRHLLKKCDRSQIMNIALMNPRKILENSYI